MSLDLIFGIFIGFVISFVVLKRTINKSGYGQLKMCRDTCPYYRSAVNDVVKTEVTHDD